MANNTINETEYIPKKEIRQLPDRSDLSGLYFETKQGYQKGSINFESSSNESPREQYLKFINKNFAKIGILLPLPISTGFFLYGYFSESELIEQSPMISLPFVILSLAIFITVMAVSYKKIKEILEKLGIGATYFFIYNILCMALIYAPAFLISSQLKDASLVHLATYSFVAAFCIVTTKILLVALGDEKINSRISTILRGIPLAICLVVAVIFGYFLF